MGGGPSAVRAPVRERIAAHRPRRPSARPSPARLLAGAEPGGHGLPARPRWHASIAHPRRRDGPGDGIGGDREGRRRHLGRPSAGCRARAGPPGEHPVRRRRQPVRRRPWHRRDLHRHRLVRDPRLRRPGAAGWRAGDAGCGHLLTGCVGLRGPRRFAATRRWCTVAPRRCRRRRHRPGDRSRPTRPPWFGRRARRRAACGTGRPAPAVSAVRADAQPVPGPGAVRGGRRPRFPWPRTRWSRTWSRSSGGNG